MGIIYILNNFLISPMWKNTDQKRNNKYMPSTPLHVFYILFEMLLEKHQ